VIRPFEASRLASGLCRVLCRAQQPTKNQTQAKTMVNVYDDRQEKSRLKGRLYRRKLLKLLGYFETFTSGLRRI